LFVDLVNTVSRDNVSIWSNQNHVDGRYNMFYFEDVDNEGVLQRYNSHTTAVCPCCFFASQYIRTAWWFAGLEEKSNQLWWWMRVVMTGVHGMIGWMRIMARL
jgi:hypothetical protein